MKKGIFSLLLISLILILSVGFILAQTKLLCLNKGEILEFSKCNPSINDRTCDSDWKCQYCVSEIRTGVYCPANINICNNLGLECGAMDPSQDENPDDPAQNNSDINIVINNQTNGQTNNQNNQESTHTNTRSSTITPGGSLSSSIKVGNTTESSGVKNENIKLEKDNPNFFPLLLLSSTLIEFLVLIGLFVYTKKYRK